MTLSNVKCHVRWGLPLQPPFIYFILFYFFLFCFRNPLPVAAPSWVPVSGASRVSQKQVKYWKCKAAETETETGTESASNLFEAIFQFIEVEFIGSPGLERLRGRGPWIWTRFRILSATWLVSPSLTSAPHPRSEVWGLEYLKSKSRFLILLYTRITRSPFTPEIKLELGIGDGTGAGVYLFAVRLGFPLFFAILLKLALSPLLVNKSATLLYCRFYIHFFTLLAWRRSSTERKCILKPWASYYLLKNKFQAL